MANLVKAYEMAETLAREANMGPVLFATLSGSRLLNIHTDGSDWDLYVLTYPSRRAAAGLENPLKSAHKIVEIEGDVFDYTFATFGAFLAQVLKGSPNASNALWAPILSEDGYFSENRMHLLIIMRDLVSTKVVSSLMGWALQEQNGETAKQRRRASALMNLAWTYAKYNKPIFNGVQPTVPTYEEIKRLLTRPDALPERADPESVLHIEELWTSYLVSEYYE